ncbi:MAG: nucleotidyltransferase domain-containing protein [Acidobacteria bacterium]|nr:nucleotidyltransferase domain-containing protein [Acidobacteriota bacterium]
MSADLERSPRDVTALLRAALPRLTEVCRAFGVRTLVIFGSVAKGEARPASDVDLAVDFGKAVAPGTELDFLGSVVDAVGTDRLDVVNVCTAPPLALREVALHGTAIFEREPGTFARLQMAALGRYMDTARFRRLRSELLRGSVG